MQVKSKKRVQEHGEVLTNEREVKAMLDLVKDHTYNKNSTFLEPACGNGNFLIEVLSRKLDAIFEESSKEQKLFDRNAVIVFSSVYGVDLLEDNIQECKERLFAYFAEFYKTKCKFELSDELTKSIKFILDKNIQQGDALAMTKPNGEPIVFAEWKPINGNKMIRTDYSYAELLSNVEFGKNEVNLFSDTGQPVFTPKFIKKFNECHYLELWKND